MQPYPFALQLYSVRDYCEKDPEDGLRQVKACGYDHVELAGMYGLEAADFKALLDKTALTPVSMHVGFEQIVGNTAQVIQDAKTLQVDYVVVPWLGEETCPDKEHWLMAAQSMDVAGATLRGEGLHLCYHNHAHEFVRYEGTSIFDLIYDVTNTDSLKSELDTCWALIGGEDAAALLQRYAGRVPLVHIKDCKAPVENEPVVWAELGRGIMDLGAVLAAAKDAGATWFIVEQDESEGDTMESAATNAAFMQAQNAAATQ